MRLKTRQQKERFFRIFLLFLGVSGVVIFALGALQEHISYFVMPSDIQKSHFDKQLRLGGLVKPGSMKRDGDTLIFNVTDDTNEITVRFHGIAPNLFKEGQGVIADGTLNQDKIFKATRILAKHDERYIPKNVADRLKQNDLWRAPQTGGKALGNQNLEPPSQRKRTPQSGTQALENPNAVPHTPQQNLDKKTITPPNLKVAA